MNVQMEGRGVRGRGREWFGIQQQNKKGGGTEEIPNVEGSEKRGTHTHRSEDAQQKRGTKVRKSGVFARDIPEKLWLP